MPQRSKTVYRDKATGRLITRKEAEGRDRSDYTVEEFEPGALNDDASWRESATGTGARAFDR